MVDARGASPFVLALVAAACTQGADEVPAEKPGAEQTVNLRSYVTTMWEELEAVANAHDELLDTSVRETLGSVLNYYFVWEKPQTRLPTTYGMFSRTGDTAVAAIVGKFLRAALPAAAHARLATGQPRHDALQDMAAQTRSGMTYDEFIGYADTPASPTIDDAVFAPGRYDDE